MPSSPYKFPWQRGFAPNAVGKMTRLLTLKVDEGTRRVSVQRALTHPRKLLSGAEGNAQLKDPNGSITRADRFEALDDFRDAFVQSLSVVLKDDTRIAADRASRREGNVTEYEYANAKRHEHAHAHAHAHAHNKFRA